MSQKIKLFEESDNDLLLNFESQSLFSKLEFENLTGDDSKSLFAAEEEEVADAKQKIKTNKFKYDFAIQISFFARKTVKSFIAVYHFSRIIAIINGWKIADKYISTLLNLWIII